MSLINFSLILLGGGLGALFRFVVSRFISERVFTVFPLGTLVVNATGSLLMGFFFTVINRAALSQNYRFLITIGFIGAYTTFSTYALETVTLLQKGQYGAAFWNFFLNNGISFVAILLGTLLAQISRI
ncbi:MAG: fluoride efflux transporter CrcB [Treponemataceae bacterium]|nr:fluoride efflux transporter CrcB [Treponemataceae bacterium]